MAFLRNKQPKLCKERGSNRGRKRHGRMVKTLRHLTLVNRGSQKAPSSHPKMSNINLFSYWNRTPSPSQRATTIIVGETNAIVRRSLLVRFPWARFIRQLIGGAMYLQLPSACQPQSPICFSMLVVGDGPMQLIPHGNYCLHTSVPFINFVHDNIESSLV